MRSKLFGVSKEYTEPVYVVEDDEKFTNEILLQILENQCAFLLTSIKKGDLDSELHRHFIDVRRDSITILQKRRKTHENDPHKS